MKKLIAFFVFGVFILSSVVVQAQQTGQKVIDPSKIVNIFDKEKVSTFLGLNEKQQEKIFNEIDKMQKTFKKIRDKGEPIGDGKAAASRSGGNIQVSTGRRAVSSERQMSGTGFSKAHSNFNKINKHIKKIQKELTKEQKELFKEVVTPINRPGRGGR